MTRDWTSALALGVSVAGLYLVWRQAQTPKSVTYAIEPGAVASSVNDTDLLIDTLTNVLQTNKFTPAHAVETQFWYADQAKGTDSNLQAWIKLVKDRYFAVENAGKANEHINNPPYGFLLNGEWVQRYFLGTDGRWYERKAWA